MVSALTSTDCFALQKTLHCKMVFCFLLALCGMASACATPTVDYSLNVQNIRVKNSYDAPVGSIHLQMSEDDEPLNINVSRMRGGYMLHTPAYESEKTRAHWVI